MLRLALAAIVFCSTLFGFVEPGPLAALLPERPSLAATQAGVSDDCSPDDSDGQWQTPHRTTAHITEWVSKWRSVHAQVAAVTIGQRGVVITASADLSDAHAPRAPEYLLHTPLLI